MRSAHALVVRSILLLAVLTATSLAQKGVIESRVGLELKPPKTFTELPGGGDRGATLRLFAAPRALAAKLEGSTHVPTLRVMFFQKGGDDAKDLVDGLPRTTPFRGLDDWIARGHGKEASIKSREAKKAGGFEGQRFTAIVKSAAGERTLLGHAIPLDDGELVVVCELLSDHVEKLKKDVDACLDTLAPAPRDPKAAAPGPATPEAGWKPYKSKHWTVLSQADPAFTKKAIVAAEAARDWCVAKLGGFVGKTAKPATLRIFASVDQHQAFLTTRTEIREYSAERRELWFFEDKDAGSGDGYGMLLRAVLWHALDDADAHVLPALPRWLDNGFWEHLRSSKLKGNKLEFAPGDVEKGRIDYQQRNETMPALWELMQESIQTTLPENADDEPWGYTPECARLVRWLCDHDGEKAFGKPGLLGAYCKVLAAAHTKLGADPTADVDSTRVDDAQRKLRNQRQYAWRDALLKAVNDEYFPNEAEWRAANDKWLKFNVAFQ